MLKTLAYGAALAMAAVAAPAMAAPPTTINIGGCDVTDILPTAMACSGFYDKNVLSNSPTDIATQISALGSLGFTWNGDWSSVEHLGGSGSYDAPSGTQFKGITYVGIHFSSSTDPKQVTAFYKFDAGAGLDEFLAASKSASNAVLYATNVAAAPEPATWLMMIVGFGMTGAAIRSRRKAVFGPASV